MLTAIQTLIDDAIDDAPKTQKQADSRAAVIFWLGYQKELETRAKTPTKATLREALGVLLDRITQELGNDIKPRRYAASTLDGEPILVSSIQSAYADDKRKVRKWILLKLDEVAEAESM